MINARFSILALLMLASCASGQEQYAGDPPAGNYRTVLAGKFLQQFGSQYRTSDVLIGKLQPGARDIVNGWRVCVKATPRDPAAGTSPVQIAYFYVLGRISNVTVGDQRCGSAQYEPWAELAHAEGWQN